MILQHLTNCILRQWSSALLNLAKCAQYEAGMHSPLQSESAVPYSGVQILTASSLSKTSQFITSGPLYRVGLHCLQSRWHAFNDSLQNFSPLQDTFPSQFHPPDHQAHLKAATSSCHTRHRVSRILVSL